MTTRTAPPVGGVAHYTAVYRDVLRETLVNTAMAVGVVRRWRLRRPRNSSSFGGSPALLNRYAFQALRELERLTGPLRGRSIVEFGPGDHLAAGLTMLGAGASHYAALDRFVSDYSSAAAKRWYVGVHEAWADSFPKHPWPADLRPADFPEAYPDRVRTIAEGVEGSDIGSAGGTYDVVTSWQVGEHVTDISAFARLTARLLAPGGVAVHRVDFGPHDCWQKYHDPLTFLRFRPALWHAMSSNRGSPNRHRHHEFLTALRAAGLAVTCHDVTTFDLDAIQTPKLHPSFRNMPADSLAVRDVIYVCRLSQL